MRQKNIERQGGRLTWLAYNMYWVARKTHYLKGTVVLPTSKSTTIRGFIFATLSHGQSTLINPLDSDDTHAAMHACASLGARFEKQKDGLRVLSNGLPLLVSSDTINTGNSGITTRFTLPLLGLRQNHETPVILDCFDQMRARSMKPLIDVLRQLGMSIEYCRTENELPISVTGKLIGGDVEIEGTHSQYVSALLISLPCALRNSVIAVKNLNARPYVDMTLDFLTQQSIDITHTKAKAADYFTITGNQRYAPIHYLNTADFSSASCLIAAAALIPGEVAFHGLDCNSTQGDKKLLDVLREMGADIRWEEGVLYITGNKKLKGIRIDANAIPDLLPALAVIGTAARGFTEIVNVAQARMKETDRIRSMCDGLRAMGARIDELPDGMTIYESELKSAMVDGCDDHRTVMALTVAGLLAEGETPVSDSDAVCKTYPLFFDHLQSLGAAMSLS